jgi:hypothetical protein
MRKRRNIFVAVLTAALDVVLLRHWHCQHGRTPYEKTDSHFDLTFPLPFGITPSGVPWETWGLLV